ncbi:hypothetical protein GGI35DRAFT_478315 [Trichoderma velutinum]
MSNNAEIHQRESLLVIFFVMALIYQEEMIRLSREFLQRVDDIARLGYTNHEPGNFDEQMAYDVLMDLD